MKYSNLFFFYHINELGGIESWYYYIAKKYSKYDIILKAVAQEQFCRRPDFIDFDFCERTADTEKRPPRQRKTG